MVKIANISLDYYNKNVIKRMMDKYNYDQMEATRIFLTSKTHELLEAAENGLWQFGDKAIFEIWECEKDTGTPLNSIYLNGD